MATCDLVREQNNPTWQINRRWLHPHLLRALGSATHQPTSYLHTARTLATKAAWLDACFIMLHTVQHATQLAAE